MKSLNRSHTLRILLLLAAFMVSACARTTPPESAPTLLPVPTATAVPPTPAPTLTPTAAPTPTLEPTAVPVPTLTYLGDYPLLSPEDMRYDLDELFHRLETTHPNPYARRPKAEVDLERARIYAELARPLTMPKFFEKVAPLVYSLGDLHTEVYLPNAIFNEIGKSERFFPFSAQIEGERAYITVNYSGNADIALGTELLSINNIPIATIWDEVRGYYPTSRYLWPLHLLFLFGSPLEYQVTLLPPETDKPVTQTVSSITGSEMMQQAATTGQPIEPVMYRTLPGEPIGVLTINTFYTGLGPALKSAFIQIQEDGVQDLILDVRANSGGYYAQVQSIMDYLADKPYKLCALETQAPFRGYGSGEPRVTECEVFQPFAVAERYQGKIYLLIGPDTFSGAITLATILQDYDMALLIGEETIGSASYCAGIPSEPQTLPRTGLRYQCSQECYVRPSGVLDDQPVVPDMIVRTTITDEIAGYDPVLTYTLAMIRSEMP